MTEQSVKKECLNLGCGRNYIKSHGDKNWTNADISPDVKPDVVCDITDVIPFRDDTFDEVLCENILTQILYPDIFVQVMNDLWRITKHKGEVIIKVPLAPYENSFRDPMDCRMFTSHSFDYLIHNTRRWENYGKHYGFRPWHELEKEIDIREDYNESWGTMTIKLRPVGRQKQSPPFLGMKHTEETKEKQSNAQKGEKGSNWQGGKTEEKDTIRNSAEYKKWRMSVFERDNYTCQKCDARSGNGKEIIINADHVKPFSKFPKLRLDTNNGRTLCIDCHKETDTYGFRVNLKKYEE